MAKKSRRQEGASQDEKNKASVAEFIASVDNDSKRADAKAIDKMLREVTGAVLYIVPSFLASDPLMKVAG